MVLCVHEIVQHELFDAVADGVHAAGPLRRTEPEPHLLEISLRESAHGIRIPSSPLNKSGIRTREGFGVKQRLRGSVCSRNREELRSSSRHTRCGSGMRKRHRSRPRIPSSPPLTGLEATFQPRFQLKSICASSLPEESVPQNKAESVQVVRICNLL